MSVNKMFAKYVSQNIMGMIGISLYILADTFFISKAQGADGITALNLVTSAVQSDLCHRFHDWRRLCHTF